MKDYFPGHLDDRPLYLKATTDDGELRRMYEAEIERLRSELATAQHTIQRVRDFLNTTHMNPHLLAGLVLQMLDNPTFGVPDGVARVEQPSALAGTLQMIEDN